MGKNAKEIKVISTAKPKKNPYKNDIISDDMGQWKYPGQPTRIHSGDITMDGVPYPVLGVDDLGNQELMLPGMDYTFPGQYVDEFPMARNGGTPKSLKKYTNKNIKSSINYLMRRNETLFGPSGKKFYRPMQDGGATGWLDEYDKGGPIKKGPVTGLNVADRQDSLDLYNNSVQQQSYYNSLKAFYKKPEVYNWANGFFSDKELSKLEHENLVHENLSPANKNIISSNKDPNVKYFSDLVTPALDPKAPLLRYDKRISPQGQIRYEPKTYLYDYVDGKKMSHEDKLNFWVLEHDLNKPKAKEYIKKYNLDPKIIQEKVRFDKVVSKQLPGYTTTLPYYDPLAVKPNDLLTPKERELRIKKYGTTGIAKTISKKVETEVKKSTPSLKTKAEPPVEKYWTKKDVTEEYWNKLMKMYPGAIGLSINRLEKHGFHAPVYPKKKEVKTESPVEEQRVVIPEVKQVIQQDTTNTQAPVIPILPSPTPIVPKEKVRYRTYQEGLDALKAKAKEKQGAYPNVEDFDYTSKPKKKNGGWLDEYQPGGQLNFSQMPKQSKKEQEQQAFAYALMQYNKKKLEDGQRAYNELHNPNNIDQRAAYEGLWDMAQLLDPTPVTNVANMALNKYRDQSQEVGDWAGLAASFIPYGKTVFKAIDGPITTLTKPALKQALEVVDKGDDVINVANGLKNGGQANWLDKYQPGGQKIYKDPMQAWMEGKGRPTQAEAMQTEVNKRLNANAKHATISPDYRTEKQKDASARALQYIEDPSAMDYFNQIGYMPSLALSNPFNMGEKLKEIRKINSDETLSGAERFKQLMSIGLDAGINGVTNALTEGLAEGLLPGAIDKLSKLGKAKGAAKVIPNVTPAPNKKYFPISAEEKKDLSGFLERRQFLKELQEKELVGKNLNLNEAAKFERNTKHVTQKALDHDMAAYRAVTGKVPPGGKGYNDVGNPYDMSSVAHGNDISEFDNMIKAGVNMDDPISIAKYQATHVPMQNYAYRSGLPRMSKADGIYAAATPAKGYGDYLFKIKPKEIVDYSQGNYRNWLDRYMNHPTLSKEWESVVNQWNAPSVRTLKSSIPKTYVGKKGDQIMDIDQTFPFIDTKKLNDKQKQELNDYIKRQKEEYEKGWIDDYYTARPKAAVDVLPKGAHTIDAADYMSLEAPKGNMYGQNQTLTQQSRLLNPEVKAKFFKNQAQHVEPDFSKKGLFQSNFVKIPKDYGNRITPENYEDFVKNIHGSTDYGIAEPTGFRSGNLGIGNYGKPGMVFSDAPLNNLGKDIINAHEKNHGMFAGTLSKEMRQDLLKPFGTSKPVPKYGAADQPDEVLARMAQFKNAIGIGDNQTFTLGHLNLIRKNYADSFLDNGITEMLKKLKPGSAGEKHFLKNMNKYAFGLAPAAVVGATAASINKKQQGGAALPHVDQPYLPEELSSGVDPRTGRKFVYNPYVADFNALNSTPWKNPRVEQPVSVEEPVVAPVDFHPDMVNLLPSESTMVSMDVPDESSIAAFKQNKKIAAVKKPQAVTKPVVTKVVAPTKTTLKQDVDLNTFNSPETYDIVVNRQKEDYKKYHRFTQQGSDIMNRTDMGRNKDSEKYIQDLLSNRKDNSVIIDIGSALGNKDSKLAGVSVKELYDNPVINQKAHIIATDIPSEMKVWNAKKDKYAIDVAEVSDKTFNTDVQGILNTKKLNANHVILRAANSIDLIMDANQTVEHFKHLGNTLKDKEVTYVYNNAILYKPKGSTKFAVKAKLNNAAFDHKSADGKNWVTDKNRKSYTNLSSEKEFYKQKGGQVNWLDEFR